MLTVVESGDTSPISTGSLIFAAWISPLIKVIVRLKIQLEKVFEKILKRRGK